MNRPRNLTLLTVFLTSLFAIASVAEGERRTPGTQAPRAIRALYVTGGGFHEFVKQETILPPAVAQRVKVDWTIDHTAGKSTEVLIERHKNTDWTKDFDVVLYNMSFSFVVDVPWIERLAGAHRDSGVGAVILHGAVHSYRRSESRAWGELMGAFSLRHDSQRPLTVETVAPQHPIMRGFPANWQTTPEELYELERVWPTHDAAGRGVQRRIEEDATRSSGRTRTARPAWSSRRWGTTPRSSPTPSISIS